MERELWLRFRVLAAKVCGWIPHPSVSYSDRWILLVYAWAVVHDRPVSWACRPSHWPADLRPARLPSQPTMSRRLRTGHIQWALALIMARLRGDPSPDDPPPDDPPPDDPAGGPPPPTCFVKVIDGKPLPVGGFSKDRDARRGYGAGMKYRGYKLHALWGAAPVPDAWEVRSAEHAESTEARRLLDHLRGYGVVLGDAAYDCNDLYDQAMGRGHQLIAPKKRPGTGLGHGRQSEWRLQGLALLGTPSGRRLYALRSAIERRFGGLTSFGGGLAGLPPWARRSGRVGMWVEMKLILNGLRSILHHRVTA